MDEAGDGFLARARGATDQNPAIGRRHAFNELADLHDPGALPDQRTLHLGARPQLCILAAQTAGLESPLHRQQELVALEGLFQEVVGPLSDRRDRRLDRTVAGDHDDRQIRVHRAEFLE